jgi:hypothetical protein
VSGQRYQAQPIDWPLGQKFDSVKVDSKFRSTLPLGEGCIMYSRRPVWIALMLMVLAVLAGVAATTVLSAQAISARVESH